MCGEWAAEGRSSPIPTSHPLHRQLIIDDKPLSTVPLLPYTMGVAQSPKKATPIDEGLLAVSDGAKVRADRSIPALNLCIITPLAHDTQCWGKSPATSTKAEVQIVNAEG